MAKLIWKDDYKKSANGEPAGSELGTKSGMRVVVHHYIGYPPEQWLATTYGPNLFDRLELKAKTLAEAKLETLATARTVLQTKLKELGE
jgi:hypothetical protein